MAGPSESRKLLDMLKKTPLTITLLVAAAVTLTGCSNAGNPDYPTAPETAEQDVATSTAETIPPLTAYLDSLYGLSGSPDEQAQQRAARRMEQEELISACMKREGFEYTPEPVDADSFGREAGPSQADLDSPDWVAQYGYGALETPEGRVVDSAVRRDTTPADDPNRVYEESLTTSERTAYNTAMNGQSADKNADLNIVDDWERMGCQGEARHTTGTGADPLGSTAGASVQSTIDDFYDSSADWPGRADLDAAWAGCMAENGYAGYARQGDAATEITAKINEAMDAAGSGNEPADAEALLEQERETAVADLGCREDTDFRATVLEVTIAAETRFMEDNRAELDAFAASVEQAGAR